jgi:hypothetical protein
VVLGEPTDPAARVIIEIAQKIASAKLGLAKKLLGITPV